MYSEGKMLWMILSPYFNNKRADSILSRLFNVFKNLVHFVKKNQKVSYTFPSYCPFSRFEKHIKWFKTLSFHGIFLGFLLLIAYLVFNIVEAIKKDPDILDKISKLF